MSAPRWLAAVLWGGLVVQGRAAGAASIVIDNRDGPGEGFNDPSPFTPVGGNTAVTLGQARLNAFAFAASIWGARLASGVPIRVEAAMDALTCTPTSATLGTAGTRTVHRDFPGAVVAGTWYPQALANALAATDLDPFNGDIIATFNSLLDGGACLGGARWYYGLDGLPPPGDVDLVTILLHELGHGLGFQTFVTLSTGARLADRDDLYMRLLERDDAVPAGYPAMSNAQRVAASTSDPHLQWIGTRVNTDGAGFLMAGVVGGRLRMHAPAPQQPGSSVSHFSVALAPDQLMEPFYTGPDHDVALTASLLYDLGWAAAPPVAVRAVPASSPWLAALLAVALLAVAARAARPAPAAGRPAPRWWRGGPTGS